MRVGRADARVKELIERLYPNDATALAINPDRLTYTRLADLSTAAEKARHDAPAIAVCEVYEPAGVHASPLPPSKPACWRRLSLSPDSERLSLAPGTLPPDETRACRWLPMARSLSGAKR